MSLKLLLPCALFLLLAFPTATGSAIIAGTSSAETLIGTPGADWINGRGGNDILRGRGGSDTMIGLGGNDSEYAGQGSDYLYGGKGRDNLNAGARDGALDRLDGGDGYDVCRFRGVVQLVSCEEIRRLD